MCWIPIPTAPKVAAPKSEKIRRTKDERNSTDMSHKQSFLNYSVNALARSFCSRKGRRKPADHTNRNTTVSAQISQPIKFSC